ncbi:MAG: DNA polymerase III subunit gamma/tau [Clostridiales bacterium]|nr:DNA polymerase III subunit gamma/tau [Clostridiales bacterium]
MYQVLYRKYRPKVFSDVYGQDHIVSTLKNEIKENRISHAYLFTGSRGTGKTTCAKILAKAVNCTNNIDGEPCNECEVCKAIDSGAIYDVVEMDAASNNSVDNIRDLREEVNYTPTKGRYRVYIIDEVHMLSQSAFNALLKTLEEPPKYVIFILATTEVHKLPATILSRCQRFDFKRIKPETMSVRLMQVAELEGLELTGEAAVLIARIADGALRDGLSILDQCSSRSKSIDAKLVSEVAGIAGREALYKLSDCIIQNDSSSAMQTVASLYQNSFDMERLCVEMINHFRNFLVVKTVKKNRELIICTDDEYNSICEAADKFSLENIIYALDLFQTTLTQIKSGASARTEIEMAFIRLCSPKLDDSQGAILNRISTLERIAKTGAFSSPAPQIKAEEAAPEEEREIFTPSVNSEVENQVDSNNKNEIELKNDIPVFESEEPIVRAEPQIKPEPTNDFTAREEYPPIPEPEPIENNEKKVPENQNVRFELWDEFMDVIHDKAIALYGILLGANGYIRGEYFLIDSPNPTVKEFIKSSTSAKSIKQALYEVTGKTYKLGILKRDEEASHKDDPLEQLISKAQNNIKINFE